MHPKELLRIPRLTLKEGRERRMEKGREMGGGERNTAGGRKEERKERKEEPADKKILPFSTSPTPSHPPLHFTVQSQPSVSHFRSLLKCHLLPKASAYPKHQVWWPLFKKWHHGICHSTFPLMYLPICLSAPQFECKPSEVRVQVSTRTLVISPGPSLRPDTGQGLPNDLLNEWSRN